MYIYWFLCWCNVVLRICYYVVEINLLTYLRHFQLTRSHNILYTSWNSLPPDVENPVDHERSGIDPLACPMYWTHNDHCHISSGDLTAKLLKIYIPVWDIPPPQCQRCSLLSAIPIITWSYWSSSYSSELDLYVLRSWEHFIDMLQDHMNVNSAPPPICGVLIAFKLFVDP